MTSRKKSWTHLEGTAGRLGSLAGLLAFLPFLLLPLVFYVHLTAAAPPALSGDLETEFPVMESQDGEPAASHDGQACHICQNASSFQHYGISAAFHAPDSSIPAGRLADGSHFLGFASAEVGTAANRAPPVVPRQHATA